MIAVAGTRGKDLFLEYLDDTVTTSRSFLTDDSGIEWLLTGDLAKSDEIGDLSFVGRVDDVVKVSGKNVSLTEVSVIAQAPVSWKPLSSPLRIRYEICFLTL